MHLMLASGWQLPVQLSGSATNHTPTRSQWVVGTIGTCTRHYVLRGDVGEYKIPIAIASMYHIDDILLLTRINHESLQHTHAHIQCFLSSSL